MAASLNLHRLFSMEDGYLNALRVPDRDVHALRKAREEIRSALRTAFSNWDQYVTRAALFEGVAKTAASPQALTPRFHIQGSFAYFTVNDCQRTPPQQIDQDDGVFLPISFLMHGGKAQPSVVSRSYFEIVEGALAPLCLERNWSIEPKNTCVRVVLSPRLHIDLPLYAIRDDVFETAIKARATTHFERIEKVYEREELDEEVYTDIARSDVMLAHRTRGWIHSAPRALERWFANVRDIHGEQVRRVVRCFKGLRDDAWEKCDLTSIALMKAIADAYDMLGPLDQNRDDLALILVGEKLVDIFAGPIVNPVIPDDPACNLDAKWSAEFRAALISEIQARTAQLRDAVHITLNKTVAIQRARAAFGERIPDAHDLIVSIGIAGVIRSERPQPQPQPVVPRTKSG
jgi:hypothetical protein